VAACCSTTGGAPPRSRAQVDATPDSCLERVVGPGAQVVRMPLSLLAASTFSAACRGIAAR